MVSTSKIPLKSYNKTTFGTGPVLGYFWTVQQWSYIESPLGLSKSGLTDSFWAVPKVVSYKMDTGCVNEDKHKRCGKQRRSGLNFGIGEVYYIYL